MSANSVQDIFEIKTILENISIKFCARCENGVKQLLALVTSDGDVVLHYTYGELSPVLKRIPWFNDSFKQLEAICFDPSATWLLLVSLDCSLYIIPALSLVDKKQKIDCKWSLTDLTHFPRPAQIPDSKPTSVIWWQTLDSNQNALVGFENGAVVLISLTDGRCIGSCSITEGVKDFDICHDNNLDVSLLINGTNGQQWRLVLEQHLTGYLWPPPEAHVQTDDSTRSRLYNLKQLGVDKLASLKQRLTESRSNRGDCQSDSSSSSSSRSESSSSVASGPELLPQLCDTHFAPQYARNRYLFTAFYKPTSLLTVHAVDVESAPLYVHKLPQRTSSVLLTDRLIYTVNDESKSISVISSQLCECRLGRESEFNSDALVAQFYLDSGKILKLFKLSDLTTVRSKKRDDHKRDKFFELPTCVDDLNLQKPRIDTCVVVTDSSVFKICVSCSPTKKFVDYVTEEHDLEKAERLSNIFGLNIQQLLECCGDLLISRGSYHSGIIFYKEAKVHLLKRVLKLAISADCRTLLKFIHLCLSASKVEMSIATKIHIGNLAVMAYTELILRYGGHQRVSNTKDFMNFLSFEEYYDQILAVNVACQAGHWNIVMLLAKSRGLQPEVVTALGQILQSSRAPKPTERDFMYCISEPCLTQSLLIFGQCSQYIFQYIRENVDIFPVDILRRLAVQLDPSQPSAVPLVSRLFQTNKYSSSLDTTIESVDFENPDRTVVTIKDLIDTFLIVLIHLVWKTEANSFELPLLDVIKLPEASSTSQSIRKLPDLRPLDCGFEHAAVVRNNCVYTMGVSNSGCLGLGPLLTQSSPPRLVQTLSELKVKVLSVSCGKRHTLALTDFGVFSWGSNAFGQLGLGRQVNESPYPQILQALSTRKIIDLAAGQYHSVAVSSSGRVFTWGWGIHGQLGHGNCDNEFVPKLLDFPHVVRQVAAGHAHTLMLTEDGKLYGFGSNVFGQLEGGQGGGNKLVTPKWLLVPADSHRPIEKIASAYFHNIAALKDQEVHTWGASPQEVRMFQSKNNQKQSGKPSESWKTSTHIYTGSLVKKSIEQVAVGYRHSVVLHNGKLLWGKNREEELSSPKLKPQEGVNAFFVQKFTHVSCGLDYTMAIDNTGKVLAWVSPSMAQTILGKSVDDDDKKPESRVIFFKNSKRVIKIPTQNQPSGECPVEVPGLPSMAITFNPSDQKLLLSKNFTAYAVRTIENEEVLHEQGNASSAESLYEVPKVKFGNRSLHYVLETYHGLYDTDNVLSKCIEAQNYQAAAKIAMLDGHFGDSLGFQLTAFKRHLDSLNLDLDILCKSKESPSESNDYIGLTVRNIQDDLNEKNLAYSNNSPAHILSTSSSLDSIRQWGDDVEHQGGKESPCDAENGDIRQNISQYVQSLKHLDNSPINTISKLVADKENGQDRAKQADCELQIKDKAVLEILEAASYLVEFYIRKIYISENHILMQNILMKCIEFWLSNNLPVSALESVLLKNMDKYFYPLSILLFCKDFSNPDDDELKPASSGFLKEFSTKFCLQLCSMVMENVDKV